MSINLDRLSKMLDGKLKAGMTEDAGFKLIADKIEKFENENKLLDKKLTSMNENYKLVSENYDLAFQFFAEKLGVDLMTAFGQFKKWLEAKFANKEG